MYQIQMRDCKRDADEWQETHRNETRIGKAAGKECSEARQDD